MAEYLIQSETLDDIADAINAKTGKTAAMTPAEMVSEIEGIETGATIADGVIIKTRDSEGHPKSIEFYSQKIGRHMFGVDRADTQCGWRYVSEIDFKYSDVEINWRSFQGNSSINRLETSAITHLASFIQYNSNLYESSVWRYCTNLEVVSLPEYSGFLNHYDFDGCTKLKTVYLPKITRLASYGSANRSCFRNCTALQDVQIGSIGYPVTHVDINPFLGCTNTEMVLTLYCSGAYVDTALTNSRRGATNATIIIKAAEDTEYNGTAYAAGDTILTSEVEQTS